MTRTLAMIAVTAFAIHLGGCASTSGDSGTALQATDSGYISQASYATGDTLVSASPNQGHGAPSSSSQPYLLDSGDRVRITVYGEPDLSKTYLIDDQGKISLPLIGAVEARGRGTTRLSQIIANRLGGTYIREPQVTVSIDRYRPFFILGSVRKSGQYPYISGMTVEAAVATAGGFAPNANQHAIRRTRRVDGVPAVVEVPSQFMILPGDSIYVNESFLWPTEN